MTILYDSLRHHRRCAGCEVDQMQTEYDKNVRKQVVYYIGCNSSKFQKQGSRSVPRTILIAWELS